MALSAITVARRISKKIEKIDKQIENLEYKIEDLQDSCPHPFLKEEYKGSSGNYDPSADCFWKTHRCPDCKKYWVTDYNKETGQYE